MSLLKKYIPILLLLLFSKSFYSQISYGKRIEIEDEFNDNGIYEFGEQGFIFSTVNFTDDRQSKNWVYDFYNTDLEKVSSVEIDVDKKLRLDEKFSDGKELYSIFKNVKGDFVIVTVNPQEKSLESISGSLPRKCRIRDMVVSGDFAYFKSVIKGNSYLFTINLNTGLQKPIMLSVAGTKPKDLMLESFQLIEGEDEIMLLVSAKISRKKTESKIVILNSKGDKKAVFDVFRNMEQNIISATASKLSDNSYLVLGTFAKDSKVTSEGIYISKITDGQLEYIKFYNYIDLQNFLSYLPEKRQKKIEKKKKRKESRGNDFALNYNIAAHDVIVRDDGYLLIGEAYYATYYTETYTTTSTVNGHTTVTTHTRQVFDGYQYTHAYIAKFGFDGDLIWDQTFSMWPTYKPFRVKEFISVAENDDQSVKMVYVSYNRIMTKLLGNDGQVISDFQTEEIETGFEGDKVKRSFSNIDYWYGNVFIAYWNQKIKNKENKDVERKRKIYFISKIVFE